MSDPTAPLTAERIEKLRLQIRGFAGGVFKDADIHALCDLALTALRAQQAQPVAYADKIAFESAMRAGKGCDVWPKNGTATGREIIALFLSPQAQTRREVVEECAKVCDANAEAAHEEALRLDSHGLDHTAAMYEERCDQSRRDAHSVRALAPAIQQAAPFNFDTPVDSLGMPIQQGKETKNG